MNAEKEKFRKLYVSPYNNQEYKRHGWPKLQSPLILNIRDDFKVLQKQGV